MKLTLKEFNPSETMKNKLPKEIIVSCEEEGNQDEFLEVHENIDDVAVIGERKKVGRYVLKEVITVTAEVKVL